MIAAVCAWHTHHARAADEINRRLARGEAMVVPAPALVETYSVLTRLPPPYRLSGADSLTLLRANFMDQARLATLDEAGYRGLLERAPDDGIVGGRAYDAVIAACALAADTPTLLTFNDRHFQTLAPGRLQVVVPGSESR